MNETKFKTAEGLKKLRGEDYLDYAAAIIPVLTQAYEYRGIACERLEQERDNLKAQLADQRKLTENTFNMSQNMKAAIGKKDFQIDQLRQQIEELSEELRRDKERELAEANRKLEDEKEGKKITLFHYEQLFKEKEQLARKLEVAKEARAEVSNEKAIGGIIIPERPPPSIVEALNNFVNAVFNYEETGVWPDNGTIRRLAEEGREALKHRHSRTDLLEQRAKVAAEKSVMEFYMRQLNYSSFDFNPEEQAEFDALVQKHTTIILSTLKGELK